MNKYAYSLDGELYEGEFDTAEEAAAECFATYDVEECEVSVIQTPTPPEYLIDLRPTWFVCNYPVTYIKGDSNG